jgi:hypothetical protein
MKAFVRLYQEKAVPQRMKLKFQGFLQSIHPREREVNKACFNVNQS